MKNNDYEDFVFLQRDPGEVCLGMTYIGRSKRANTFRGKMINVRLFRSPKGFLYAFRDNNALKAALNGEKLIEGHVYDLRF